jgi:Domain of unknown function (DUF4398)
MNRPLVVARVVALAAGLVFTSVGCGGVEYAVVVNSAASRVSEAKALGADQLAPYEYYFAKEHLEQAEFEAAEASYSDASNLAEEAEDHANTAIQLTEKARRARQ